jgi:hypothetical protein
VHEIWGNTKTTRNADWSESVTARDAKILKIYPESSSGELPPLPLLPQMPTRDPDPTPVPTPGISVTYTESAPSPNWEVIKNTSNGLPATATGRLIWGDYNNDGYLDAFILAGQGNGIAALYKNNGDNSFTEMNYKNIIGLSQGSALFVDYDNDGNLDLITVGNVGLNNTAMALVYKNSGAPDYTFSIDAANSANLVEGRSGSNDASGRMFETVDLNHDGWIDIVETADLANYNIQNNWRLTAAFINNHGVFEWKKDLVESNNFEQVCGGSIHVGDFNNDGYGDIVTTGYSDSKGWVANLYTNNQNGAFSLHPYSSSLSGCQKGEIIFADINGDGYDDLVEYVWGDQANIHIYNPTGGTFTKYEKSVTGLVSCEGTSITAGDVNNDGKIDLFISGIATRIATIYYNNCDLTFTPVDIPADTKARSGSVNLVDINRDGNLDFSVFGYGTDWRSTFALNKLGNGIESNEAPSAPTGFSVQFADNKYTLTWAKAVDKETPQDALRYNVYAKNKDTGDKYFYAPADAITGKLKIGGGIVPLIHQTSFDWNLPEGHYTFGVQTVDQSDATSLFTLYTEPFTSWDIIATVSNGLPMTASGRMIWGDYNNDGYKDAFFISGQGGGQASLFKNNGDGTFTQVDNLGIEGLSTSSAIFIDYDNDGDLDLIVSGKTNGGNVVTYVYDNAGASGNYAFSKNDARSAELVGVFSDHTDNSSRMLAAVDYDNDGWTDLLMCGGSGYYDPSISDWRWRFTGVFKNVNGTFERKVDLVANGNNRSDFIHTAKGSIHVGDVNGDGYADFITQGWRDKPEGGWGAYLWINNQDGTFSLSPYSSNLRGDELYETVILDVNGDGFGDLIEISKAVANIFISDGTGNNFTKYEDTATGLIMALGPSISAGDINNDGFIDLAVSGMPGNDGLFTHSSKLFYNNGDGTFTAMEVPETMQARSGSIALVDINGDNNLDYSVFGYGNGWTSTFAVNTLGDGDLPTNTPPSKPSSLNVVFNDGKFLLSWPAATDAETNTAALRYNVYAKNEDNQIFAYAPVDVTTGKLKIGGDIVPLIHQTSFEWNLPEGNYTFGVQTVDQSDATSLFTLYQETSHFTTVIWNGSEDADWTNPDNWSGNSVPDAESNVVISGAATQFPELVNNATVKTIRFQPGSELGRQDRLTYEKAFVEYDFSSATGLSRDRWYMLSLPLQEAYPGDFYFGGYPQAWLHNFTINGDMADWQTACVGTSPLTTGTGFVYRLDANDGADDRGLQASIGILRLPYFDKQASGVAPAVHYQHDFAAGVSGDVLGVSTFYDYKVGTTTAFERNTDVSYTVPRNMSAYRLAGATVDAPLNFAGENVRTGQMAIIGNPFMSTLSFDKLYESNDNKIKAGYQIWAGDCAVPGYRGYNAGGGSFGIVTTSDLDRYIAPQQAFVVEKNETYVVGEKLIFNIIATQTGGGQLRSATVETGNKLTITASNSAGAYRIFVAQREDGSNTLSGKDSRILMNNVSELPVVYTLKPSGEGIAYAGANIIPAGNREILLGLLTTYDGEMKFTFTGMDSYDSRIVLVDKTTGTETDLTGKTSFDYTFHHTPESQSGQTVALNDRFLLRISDVTGMGEVSRSIYIYPQGSNIRVISGSLIKSVMVYNLQGALIRVSYTDVVRDMAPGVYLVQVITETDSNAAKVFVKN